VRAAAALVQDLTDSHTPVALGVRSPLKTFYVLEQQRWRW
jgi:hypothetical protein